MATIGNYKFVREIGQGGFGRIFQVEHAILGEKACMKQNIRPTPDSVELLKKEAKLLWRLCEHHSIPHTKDFLDFGDYNCAIVMSYIDGETLDQAVEKNGRLHAEDACWIAERLLGALHYCQYNGVVHSDVKPGNVFIEPKKHDIKLIDFGLATLRPTSRTRPLGYTQMYAAPELLRGAPPVPETDLYGAGATLLYALGGDWERKTFPKDTPRPLQEFCGRLLHYDTTQRPNWEKENLIQTLSDIRQEVFGRRHCG